LAGSPGCGGTELGGLDRVEQAYRIVPTYQALDEHPRVDTAPAGVGLLGHASDAAAREDASDGLTRSRVARHLEQDALSEAHAAARHDGGPIEPFHRHVLADAAGSDRMALGPQPLDRLDRVETDGALLSPVVPVTVRIALEPLRRYPRRGNRRFRNSTERDADLDDSGVHYRASPRRIIRCTRASSTCSPRWFRTRWRYVTMPRSAFFVSRLSVTLISTVSVSPSSTGAVRRISPPR